MSNISMLGNIGTYIDDGNVISFQFGNDTQELLSNSYIGSLGNSSIPGVNWLELQGFQVCSRGVDNNQCDEIEENVKKNRLLPQLLGKQIKMLYGHGPKTFKIEFKDNKLQRVYIHEPEIMKWLESWQQNGCESSYTDFAFSIIKNYYYFKDFFVKWRFSNGKIIGRIPISGLECLENKHCRLATTGKNVATDNITYRDFRHILVGKWSFGASKFQIYPKFDIRNIKDYRYAAISHHREKSVGEFYGLNETHEGTKPFIKGANETADYINSFLKNSLAAKIHIIIPDAWCKSKVKQIQSICDENKIRKKDGKEYLKYNGIEIGETYRESYIIQYTKVELNKISKYLSGAGNQGKAFASISYRTGQQSHEERWQIETVDLKYKEYISSLIEYDKRADEVLLSALGLDASISSISKDGVISKSGSDAYYNYLIYLMGLNPDDEKCSEPFNLALQLCFPELYKQGIRIGFYREVPAKQSEVSPQNRLNNQQP